MDEKLKPCPCGNTDIRIYEPTPDEDRWCAVCSKKWSACSWTVYAETEHQLRTLWNRRADGPATAKLVAKLRSCGTAPDFRGIAGVNLMLTSHEAAAFLAEHEPA